jgi:4-amino-4-deoxy-L-arabinose transferase-like glycosyltransferase
MKGIQGAVSRWERSWSVVLLLAITGIGLWFRWQYARDVSFFVDEYLQLRAADRILSQGAPLLPSGHFYSHGLLLSYIETVVLGLGGKSAWVIRLPVLLLSTAAIPLAYWFGRRVFSAGAGLIAAALLAFAPEAILWGGRVRMYAPLQFFVLLATVVFYLWVVEEQDRPAYRILFVLAYWGALFSHAEAMLLLPLWGLWALLQRGWRWSLHPRNLVVFLLSGMSIVVEILLRRIGPPVQSWVAPGVFEPVSREYLNIALDWAAVQKVLAPLFLTPVRGPLVLLALGGLGYLLLSWLRKTKNGGSAQRRAMAYLYALLLPTLVVLLFVVDPSWRSPRYALMLLPHFFLISGGLLAWLGRWLQGRVGRRWAWAGITVVIVLVALGSWRSAVAATQESVPAYDWAFGYVQDHQRPDDVVITFLCPAAFWHMGQCDYLAIPTDYSGFAFEKDGRWVSGWSEVPIVDSADGLREAVAEAPGAWFVVDEGRFGGRYQADFQQAVWDEMELVAAQQEMLVFRSPEKPSTPLSMAMKGSGVSFEDGINLAGYSLEPEKPMPGQDLAIELRWTADSQVTGDYTVFVHLLDGQGQMRGQVDGPPLEGLYPTTHWQPGVTLPDRHTLDLADDLEPGRYRLVAGLYDAHSQERLPLVGGDGTLDYLWIGERPPAPVPQQALAAEFGSMIHLVGYDLAPEPGVQPPADAALTVTLYWEAVSDVDRDYTVFVHLVDEDGQIVGQGDGPPMEGSYPTSNWDPGETVTDVHRLESKADVPAGSYRLLVGLYVPEDGTRLPVTDGPGLGDDHVEIGAFRWE